MSKQSFVVAVNFSKNKENSSLPNWLKSAGIKAYCRVAMWVIKDEFMQNMTYFAIVM